MLLISGIGLYVLFMVQQYMIIYIALKATGLNGTFFRIGIRTTNSDIVLLFHNLKPFVDGEFFESVIGKYWMI